MDEKKDLYGYMFDVLGIIDGVCSEKLDFLQVQDALMALEKEGEKTAIR